MSPMIVVQEPEYRLMRTRSHQNWLIRSAAMQRTGLGKAPLTSAPCNNTPPVTATPSL